MKHFLAKSLTYIKCFKVILFLLMLLAFGSESKHVVCHKFLTIKYTTFYGAVY